jgi:hypothetical protein
MTMKNLLVLFSLLFSAGLYAQKSSLFVKAGWSGSNQVVAKSPLAAKNEAYSKNLSLTHGLTAGLEGRLGFGSRFSGITGIQYTHKGYQGEMPGVGGSPVDGKQHLHYLNVPVALGLRLFKGLSVQAGAELGYLLAARTALPGQTYNTEGFFDIYEEFDAGLLFGLEYQFGDRYFLQMRGILAFTPVLKGTLVDENGNEQPFDLYNRNLQVTAGYRF